MLIGEETLSSKYKIQHFRTADSINYFGFQPMQKIFPMWLCSGGGLLIAEMFLSDDKRGPKRVHLQSLNMLVLTSGKERTAAEYKEMLEKHGFEDIQIKKLEDSAGLDAILCRKPWI